METNRLRQFQTVCELKNLRKAADLLGMSHSALSKSLKVLQSQMNRTLLMQSGRNIEITDEGLKLLSQMEAVLEAERQLLFPEETSAHCVRIATFEVFSTHLLGSVWTKYFPDAELELRELIQGSMEQAIVSGQSDMGLSYDPVPMAGLDLLLLGKIEMKIYGAENAFQDLSFEKIPFVAPTIPMASSPTGIKGLDGWPEHKVPRWVKFKADMMETGLALARTGQAFIFLPDFVARHHNTLVSKKFVLHEKTAPAGMKKVVRKIYLIKRKSHLEDKNVRRLATLVRNECFI